MLRSPHTIESELDALMPENFDLWQQDSDGMARLHELMDEIDLLPQPHSLLPTLFRTLERLADVDSGSPGPIVHTIERIAGYETLLVESIQRKPTTLTVWMVNRILNSLPEQRARERWLTLLKQAMSRADTSSRTQQAIAKFMAFQQRKASSSTIETDSEKTT